MNILWASISASSRRCIFNMALSTSTSLLLFFVVAALSTCLFFGCIPFSLFIAIGISAVSRQTWQCRVVHTYTIGNNYTFFSINVRDSVHSCFITCFTLQHSIATSGGITNSKSTGIIYEEATVLISICTHTSVSLFLLLQPNQNRKKKRIGKNRKKIDWNLNSVLFMRI